MVKWCIDLPWSPCFFFAVSRGWLRTHSTICCRRPVRSVMILDDGMRGQELAPVNQFNISSNLKSLCEDSEGYLSCIAPDVLVYRILNIDSKTINTPYWQWYNDIMKGIISTWNLYFRDSCDSILHSNSKLTNSANKVSPPSALSNLNLDSNPRRRKSIQNVDLLQVCLWWTRHTLPPSSPKGVHLLWLEKDSKKLDVSNRIASRQVWVHTVPFCQLCQDT